MVLVLSKWGDSGSAFDPHRFHVSSYFQVLTNPPSETACMLLMGAAPLSALPACMRSPIYLSDEFECEKLLICDLVLWGALINIRLGDGGGGEGGLLVRVNKQQY